MNSSRKATKGNSSLTIKRKLFWSNVLMVIVPIVLSAILSVIIINTFDENHRGEVSVDTGLFYHIAEEIEYCEENLDRKSLEELFSEWVSRINESPNKSVSLAVYAGQNLIVQSENFEQSYLLEFAFEHPDKTDFNIDGELLYRAQIRNYTLYLQDLDYEEEILEVYVEDDSAFPDSLLLFVAIVGAFVITGRVITYLVFRSIATPLDILVEGVHEIRDGNLSYRIRYDRNDEFKTVCDDFNEMAYQTEQLVMARQKDEESRRELIAGMTHDLRTPLTSIQAYTEGLIEGVASTPALRQEYLETILYKSKDLERIIEQLFTFSKLDTNNFPFRFEVFDIGEELREYVSLVEDDYDRKGLSVHLVEVDAGACIRADKLQLRNVFTNVLENAVKYNDSENPEISITSVSRGTVVTLTFTDNGPGVPEEKLGKLFDAFYRTDKARRNPGEGSGLGLAISAKVIAQMNGAIRAQNHTDGGLSIVVDLPLVKEGLHEENSYS